MAEFTISGVRVFVPAGGTRDDAIAAVTSEAHSPTTEQALAMHKADAKGRVLARLNTAYKAALAKYAQAEVSLFNDQVAAATDYDDNGDIASAGNLAILDSLISGISGESRASIATVILDNSAALKAQGWTLTNLRRKHGANIDAAANIAAVDAAFAAFVAELTA